MGQSNIALQKTNPSDKTLYKNYCSPDEHAKNFIYIQSYLSLSTASQPFADVTSVLAYFAFTSGLKLKN